MTPHDVIYKLLYDQRMTQKDLATEMGLSSQGSVSSILRRGGMNMSTFEEMLSVFGYEMIVRPIASPQEEIRVSSQK